jgi:hypothetical protein
MPNFWADHWFFMMLGYLFIPRITLFVFWCISTQGLGWGGHPVLAFLGWIGLPRFVLGVMGVYYYPDNPVVMWTAVLVSFLIALGETHCMRSSD